MTLVHPDVSADLAELDTTLKTVESVLDVEELRRRIDEAQGSNAAFQVDAAAFLSTDGDLTARVEAEYDQRITQRLILQPRAELNFAAQDVPENRIGSGLSNAELGLRLRYEIRREFAPYVGVSWDRRFGDTARYARADGDRATSKSIVAGVRVWF